MPAAPPASADPLQLDALFDAAWRRRSVAAQAQLLALLNHFERAEQPEPLARCCLALTRLAEQAGDRRRCFELLDKGLTALSGLRESAGDTWLKLLNYQGYLYSGTGQVSAALAPLHAALRSALRLGREDEASQAALNLACTLFDLGDHAGCLYYHRLIAERCPNLSGHKTAEMLWLQARICHHEGRRDDLINVLQAMCLRDEGDSPHAERRMLAIERLLSAYLADLSEDWPASLEHGQAAWALFGEQTIPAEQFEVAWLAANATVALGNLPSARTWADRAVQAAADGAPAQLPVALRLRAKVRKADGDVEGAFADVDLALDWATRADPLGVAAALRAAIERHDDTLRELRDNETRAVADALHRVNRELAAAKTAAERAAAGQRRFLASMSHELRTPLHGVIGAAELLAAGDLSPAQRALTATIQRSGKLTLALVDDILDLRKAEEGQLQLDPVEFATLQPIEDALALVAPKAREAGCALVFTPALDVPQRVIGDDRRIQQVVLNLLSNAVRFGRGAPVHVRLSAEPPTSLRFTVEDQGPGLAPADLERIFDPYVQAAPGTARRHGGTGLGLSICRQLVSALGGELWVQSAPGAGATFGFTIPLPPAPEAENNVRQDNPDNLMGLRLLLADDDPVNLNVLALTLEALGASVEAVGDGAQARDRATATPFDLIVLDMQMPVMDGPTAARALRADGFDRPIVALTASVLAEDTAACLAAGMNLVLTKPITQARLLSALQGLLRRAASAR